MAKNSKNIVNDNKNKKINRFASIKLLISLAIFGLFMSQGESFAQTKNDNYIEISNDDYIKMLKLRQKKTLKLENEYMSGEEAFAYKAKRYFIDNYKNNYGNTRANIQKIKKILDYKYGYDGDSDPIKVVSFALKIIASQKEIEVLKDLVNKLNGEFNEDFVNAYGYIQSMYPELLKLYQSENVVSWEPTGVTISKILELLKSIKEKNIIDKKNNDNIEEENNYNTKKVVKGQDQKTKIIEINEEDDFSLGFEDDESKKKSKEEKVEKNNINKEIRKHSTNPTEIKIDDNNEFSLGLGDNQNKKQKKQEIEEQDNSNDDFKEINKGGKTKVENDEEKKEIKNQKIQNKVVEIKIDNDDGFSLGLDKTEGNDEFEDKKVDKKNTNKQTKVDSKKPPKTIENDETINKQTITIIKDDEIVDEKVKETNTKQSNFDKVMSSNIPQDVKDAYVKIKTNIIHSNNKPYVIISKTDFQIYMFDKDHKYLPSSNNTVLLGKEKGDQKNVKAKISTTPGGKYYVGLKVNNEKSQRNNGTGYIVLIPMEGQYNYSDDYTIGIHGIYKKEFEKRSKAINSTSTDDNRMSYGCPNVDIETFNLLNNLLVPSKQTGDNKVELGSLVYITKEPN